VAEYELVLFFVADAARYVIKASTALKVLFPNITLLTCFAHALDRAAKLFVKIFRLLTS
jgi:hypothetical protein